MNESSVLFPLKAIKIWSSDPNENRATLPKVMKASMLIFEKVRLQPGLYRVTYGERGSFDTMSGFDPKMVHKGFGEGELGQVSVSAKPETTAGQPFSIMATQGRTFQVSFQHLLDTMRENCSDSELSFIGFTTIDDDNPQFRETIKQDGSNISSKLRDKDEKAKYDKICGEFGISAFNTERLLKEVAHSLRFSEAAETPVMMDMLHSRLAGVSFQPMDVGKQMLEYMLPDFGELSLTDIVALRKDPSILAFRKTVFEKREGETPEKTVMEEIAKDIQSLVPASPHKIAFSGAIDLLLPPPFSEIKTGVEAVKDIQEAQRFSTSFTQFWMKLREIGKQQT